MKPIVMLQLEYSNLKEKDRRCVLERTKPRDGQFRQRYHLKVTANYLLIIRLIEPRPLWKHNEWIKKINLMVSQWFCRQVKYGIWMNIIKVHLSLTQQILLISLVQVPQRTLCRSLHAVLLPQLSNAQQTLSNRYIINITTIGWCKQ